MSFPPPPAIFHYWAINKKHVLLALSGSTFVLSSHKKSLVNLVLFNIFHFVLTLIFNVSIASGAKEVVRGEGSISAESGTTASCSTEYKTF